MSVATPTPYAVAARELLRDTLFDGARRELEHRGWSEVTMADVAAAAGVSRQTLYNEFGSRDEFAQAFVLREAVRFVREIEGALDAHRDDPQAALSAAFGRFLTAAAEDPLIRAAIGGQGEMLPFVTTQGQPLVQGAAERLCEAILARWPQASEHDAALLAECLVRLAISYATLPVESATGAGSNAGPGVESGVGSGVESGMGSGVESGAGLNAGPGVGSGVESDVGNSGSARMTASSIAELLGPYIERALGG